MPTDHRNNPTGGPFLRMRDSVKTFMERERYESEMQKQRDLASDDADRQRQQSRGCGCTGGICLCGEGE